MGKENCDEYYNVDIAPIYEILNKEYLQFTNLGILEYMDEYKPLFENKNILVGSVEVYKFKTPKNRIPSSVELIKYIHSTNIVDVNGLVIKENVIDIPITESQSTESQEIPSWIKNNAGWWADGLISERDFVKGIEFLISQGIVR